MKIRQSFLYRFGHKPPHLALAVKLHFTLGRMNVDVYLRRFDLEEQTAHRIFPLH